MDLSAIIVIIVLTALFFGAIVRMEIHPRRTKPKVLTSDITETGLKRETDTGG